MRPKVPGYQYTAKTTDPHHYVGPVEESGDIKMGPVTYRYVVRVDEELYEAYPSSETVDESVESIEIVSSVNGLPVAGMVGNFSELYPNVKHLTLRCRGFDGFQGDDQNWKNGLESLVVGKEVMNFFGYHFDDYISLGDITIEENTSRNITWRMQNTAFSNNEANWLIQAPWVSSLDGATSNPTRILICSGVVVYVDASGQRCDFPEGTLGFADNSFEAGFMGCAIHIPSTAVFGVEEMGFYDEETQTEGDVTFWKEFAISPDNPVYAVENGKIVKK